MGRLFPYGSVGAEQRFSHAVAVGIHLPPPLPHTSTADAVFVWGYQDSALRAVCPYRGATPYKHRTNPAPIGAEDRVSGRKEVAPYEDAGGIDVRGNGNTPLFPVFDPYGGRTNMIMSRCVPGVKTAARS
ncbi:MAG: hypothetical protein PUJ95_03330 [Bacteroidales bacterium]|nr:hypothetical protein [Bacteroidales bacterium]